MTGSAAPISGGPSALPNPRLLLVEANFSLCLFLCELLAGEYQVEVSTNGEQAWKSAWREPPDLVLANERLPVLSGIDLTRRLRGDVRMVRVPVLILSTNNDPVLLRSILEAGADEFLFQPFRPLELLARLRALLTREQPGRN